MNPTDANDEPLFESLRSMSPPTPEDVKSALMYQCGVAAGAAVTKQPPRQGKIWLSLAGMVAAFLGGTLLNIQPPKNSHDSIAELDLKSSDTDKDLADAKLSPFEHGSTLTAAMSPSEIFELLNEFPRKVKSEESPLLVETSVQLGVFSQTELLNIGASE